MAKSKHFKSKRCERILSVDISTLTKREILKIIALRTKEKKRTVIFTPNPQMLLGEQRLKQNRRLLNSADINIPDGIGIVIASRLTGGKIRARISGIDLAESILALSEACGYRVFLLGAERGIAKKAAKKIKKRFQNINICGTHHGYFNKFGEENKKIIKAINKKNPDIIFVCMGYPTQEKWIIENAPSILSARIFIGLGGALDVWSGKTQRAPLLFKIMGLEWLYRTVKEPRRAKIFWDIPVFLFKALIHKKS